MLHVRVQGAYRLLWYMHVCGVTGRFVRPWGAAIINEPCLFVVRLSDGTFLLQGHTADRRTVTIDELESEAAFWDTLGSDLTDGRALANLLVATHTANLALALCDRSSDSPGSLGPDPQGWWHVSF